MRVLFILFFCLMTFAAHAQQSVKLKIFNQYEAPVDQFSVTQQGEKIDYKNNGSGAVDITLRGTDSVVFSAKGYNDLALASDVLSASDTVIMKKQFSWKDLLNPMFYIVYGGLWLLLFIVFAETGLFAGFFLPGDSLLFVAGIYSENLAKEFLKLFGLAQMSNEWLDLLVLCSLISAAGIIGNAVGYRFGRKIGPAMYQWKDNLLFKKRYLHEAHDFYEKHGGGAIIFARFLPIVRTFAPIVAGIVGMDRKKFGFYNVVGCIAWVVSMIFAGHFLQIWVRNQFGFEL
ncbi:MAG: DedA family protein, partial [Chitinophagaceae bacterium]